MKTPLIHDNFSLKNLHTFGIDVKSRFYAKADSIETLQKILNSSVSLDHPQFILGGGSNILFTEDFNGLTIGVRIPKIKLVREDADHVWIEVGAGENWHHLVKYCVEQNWGGIENLALIPGTVGATPIQNIGAYGVELKDVFEELVALKILDKTLHVFKNPDCKFGYRDSIFKTSHKNQFVICSIVLRLDKKPQFHLGYGALTEIIGDNKPTLKSVMNAVIQIRTSKLPNPQEIGNAGSFFKNPEITIDAFNLLKQAYPDMPNYPLDSTRIKIPAGWLIEQCGWKGKRFGNMGVYPKQALVLVNYGGATGAQIKELAEKIQASVYEKFAIQLVAEVNIL